MQIRECAKKATVRLLFAGNWWFFALFPRRGISWSNLSLFWRWKFNCLERGHLPQGDLWATMTFCWLSQKDSCCWMHGHCQCGNTTVYQGCEKAKKTQSHWTESVSASPRVTKSHRRGGRDQAEQMSPSSEELIPNWRSFLSMPIGLILLHTELFARLGLSSSRLIPEMLWNVNISVQIDVMVDFSGHAMHFLDNCGWFQ